MSMVKQTISPDQAISAHHDGHVAALAQQLVPLSLYASVLSSQSRSSHTPVDFQDQDSRPFAGPIKTWRVQVYPAASRPRPVGPLCIRAVSLP
jgi:hypothetical protein